MSTWIWIVIALVVLLAAGLSIGLVLGRRRRITLVAPPATTPEVTGPPAKGGYRAGGSISFSETAAPPAHPVAERTEVDGQPGVGDDAAVPRDSVRRDVVDVSCRTRTSRPAGAAYLRGTGLWTTRSSSTSRLR